MAIAPYRPIRTPRGGLLASTVGAPINPQPPIDPNRAENDDVVAEMNRITSQDSDYMKLAASQGMQAAAKRGLLNSSIAVGEAQKSALAAAQPLASQNAAQAAARNQTRLQGTLSLAQSREQIASQERMQGRDLGSRAELQTQQLEAQERMQGADIRSREAIANAQIKSEEERLGRQLTAQEQQQIRDITARQSMQSEELASIEKRTSQQIASQEAQLGRQLSAQEAAQVRELAVQQAMQEKQLAQQASLTQADIASRERLAQAQIASEESRLGRQLTAQEQAQARDIANQQFLQSQQLGQQATLTREGYAQEMERAILGEQGATFRQQMSEAGQTQRANLEAASRIRQQELSNLSEQQKATLAFYLDSNRIYANSLDNLYANKDMPAPARDAAIQNMLALRNAGVNLPAIIFGTQLNWGTGPTPQGGGQSTQPVSQVPDMSVLPPSQVPVATIPPATVGDGGLLGFGGPINGENNAAANAATMRYDPVLGDFVPVSPAEDPSLYGARGLLYQRAAL